MRPLLVALAAALALGAIGLGFGADAPVTVRATADPYATNRTNVDVAIETNPAQPGAS